MIQPLTAQQAHDAEPWVVGLCLALVVAAAIPQLATLTLWISGVLLLVVWSSVYKKQGSFKL